MKRWPAGVLLTMVLSACSWLPTFYPRDPLVSRFPWPPLSQYSGPVLLQQQIRYRSDDVESVFQTVVRFDQHQLQVVVFNELGQRLSTVTYDGDDVKVTPRLNLFLDIPYPSVLMGIQFALWPPAHLAGAIEDERWFLALGRDKSRLFYKDKLVVESLQSGDVGSDPDSRSTKNQSNQSQPAANLSDNVPDNAPPLIHVRHHQLGFEMTIVSKDI